MAEEDQPAVLEDPQPVPINLPESGMDPEPVATAAASASASASPERKRRLEEGEGDDGEGEGGDVEEKKQKVGDESAGRVKLGYKEFESSVGMFDYFCRLLRTWPTNINLNKYEHEMLLDLIKKGHSEPNKKIGVGIEAFVIRYHPIWKSRCFFFMRGDKSSDDFSFRKCVDHIFPLPEDMRVKTEVNKALGGRNRGGKGGGGRGGGGRSRGRGR